MWIKLGGEYLNLDQIVRVRFNTGWKNGQEEVVAELEAFIRGELVIVTRYRGTDAFTLRDLFRDGRVNIGEKPAPALVATEAGSQATTGTLPEI